MNENTRRELGWAVCSLSRFKGPTSCVYARNGAVDWLPSSQEVASRYAWQGLPVVPAEIVLLVKSATRQYFLTYISRT